MGSFQDPDCTIFVSNVASQVTPEHLWELFLQAGPLRNVHIPTDKKTGKNRTFAFVSYRDECSVPYACELFNTLRLFKKPIYCKPTKDSKNQNSQSPAGSPNPTIQVNGNTSSQENTPNNQHHDQRRSSESGRNSSRSSFDSRDIERGFPPNRFGDIPRDRYNDSPRDRYSDNSRDRYNENSRDRYNDSSRDRYNDNSRDRYNDNSRDRHNDSQRDRYNNDSPRDSRYNQHDYRSNSPQQQGRSYDRYQTNSPNSPTTNNPSPLFLKAVNQLNNLRRNNTSPDPRNSPSRFGPIRNDNSNYTSHRLSRRQQSNPY